MKSHSDLLPLVVSDKVNPSFFPSFFCSFLNYFFVAFANAKPIVIEPIVEVEIVVPSEYQVTLHKRKKKKKKREKKKKGKKKGKKEKKKRKERKGIQCLIFLLHF